MGFGCSCQYLRRWSCILLIYFSSCLILLNSHSNTLPPYLVIKSHTTYSLARLHPNFCTSNGSFLDAHCNNIRLSLPRRLHPHGRDKNHMFIDRSRICPCGVLWTTSLFSHSTNLSDCRMRVGWDVVGVLLLLFLGIFVSTSIPPQCSAFS